MIIHDVPQRSDEWRELRLGMPTASGFENIITSRGAKAVSSDDYMHELLAEQVTRKVGDSFGSRWTERGLELEDEARRYYEFVTERKVRQVGFVMTDDGRAGCSPDGLIDPDLEGGLEIKCPEPKTHVRTLLLGRMPSQHTQQVQGCMYVCGAKWWDFMSYCPDAPPLIVRIERDEDYIQQLRMRLALFVGKMEEMRRKIDA